MYSEYKLIFFQTKIYFTKSKKKIRLNEYTYSITLLYVTKIMFTYKLGKTCLIETNFIYIN